MSEIEKKKAVRQILLWQQIGCIVVAIAEKLQVSYKRHLTSSTQATLAGGSTMSAPDSIF